MHRIIQVGVGGYGGSWLETVPACDRAEYVALVDINPDHLNAARERTGVPESACFGSVADALSAVEADALLCIVPPAHHESVINAGLNAGLHVLSEKPIAHTIESAHRILETWKNTDRVFMISQKARFHPWVRKFREIVNGGELGRMSHVTHYFRAPYYSWGEFRHKMEHPLFIEMSIHHFDLLRAVLGSDPIKAWADSWNTPYSTFAGDISGIAHFTMENGVPVTYHADAISSGDMTDWYGEISAVGETGTLTMIYPDLYIARKGANHSERVAPREAVMTVSGPQEGQLAAFEEFLNAIEEGRIPESAGIENLKSLAMVFASVDSSKDGAVKQISDYL
jgi:predicted dehydrogenase